MNLSRRHLGTLFTALALAVGAHAQPFPGKPVRIVIPFAPGGSTDANARIIQDKLSTLWGQPVIVDAKPGANTVIGTEVLARSQPDGYTIGQIPISVTRFYQLGTVPANPLSDLTYIARTSGQTFGIAVLAASPWKTLKEFVAHAKATFQRAQAPIADITDKETENWGLVVDAIRIQDILIPDDLKEVVYTMRFDRASAIYGEFGAFYTGMVMPVEEIAATL